MGVNLASRKGGREGESLSTTTWGSELCGWESLRGGLVWCFGVFFLFLKTRGAPGLVVRAPLSWHVGRGRSDGQGTARSRVCSGRLYGGAGLSSVFISHCESSGQRGPEPCLSLCRAGGLVEAQLVERLVPSEPRQCCSTQPWFPVSSTYTRRGDKQRKGCCLSAPTKPLQAHPLHPAKYCLAYGLCFPLQSHLTLITSAR